MQTERLKIFFWLKAKEILKLIVVVFAFISALFIGFLLAVVIIKGFQWLMGIQVLGIAIAFVFGGLILIVIFIGSGMVVYHWLKSNWEKAGKLARKRH